MEQVKITLKDGSVKEVNTGVTLMELAASLSRSLAKSAPRPSSRFHRRTSTTGNSSSPTLQREREAMIRTMSRPLHS